MRKNILLGLIFILSSCNDWLNVESEGSVTYINYFKNESEIEAMQNSVLSSMKMTFAPYSLGLKDYSGLFLDHYSFGVQGLVDLEPKSYLKNAIGVLWSSEYASIGETDVIIDNRYRFENVSSERADFWLGQAYFVKGLMYFQLARLWGEAPIIENSEATEQAPKQSVDAVLEKALECAEKALVLPKHQDLVDSHGKAITSKQYGSIGSVYTLLANIYAWRGGLYNRNEDWKKAEEYASKVINGEAGNYALEANMEDVVKNIMGSKRESPETIFVIENNELDENRFWAVNFSPRCPGQALIDYPYMVTDPSILEYTWDANKISVDEVCEIYPDTNDARRVSYWYKLGEVSYEDYGYVEVCNTAFINKWREPILSPNPEVVGKTVIAMNCDICVWRLADLILLRAECRSRLGLPTAIDDLNTIRRRANCSDYSGPTSSEAVRKAIFEERRRELYGETTLYFDVVRNGYWKTELSGNYLTLSDDDVKNGALYLPVHINAFSDNTLMKQNVYWLWKQ